MATTTTSPKPSVPTSRMQCMEVWGGNRAVDKAFETPGMELWVFNRPYQQSEAGGDVYYVSSCASGRITRVLLADVSGHGTLVARVALKLRELMRRNVNVISQKRFLTAINQEFAEVVHEGGFATAAGCTFFAPTRLLTVCNAGHPPPFLYRAATNHWSILSEDASSADQVSNTPLGVFDDAEYPFLKLHLKRNDLVVFYSDALIESTRSDNSLLGVQGLFDEIRQFDGRQAEQIISRLRRFFETATNGLDHDDATIIVMRASGTRTTLKDNLLALVRYARGVRYTES